MLFYHPSADDLNAFADAFALQEVHGMIHFRYVIDMKKHQICRLSRSQRALYSGHKHIHRIKYQTLEAPNGLILHYSLGDG